MARSVACPAHKAEPDRIIKVIMQVGEELKGKHEIFSVCYRRPTSGNAPLSLRDKPRGMNAKKLRCRVTKQ